jgi:hypothetical protein
MSRSCSCLACYLWTAAPRPAPLQLRNLQTLVEIGVDRNTTIVLPAPLMSTIEELGGFLTRERSASVPTVRLAGETEPARNGGAVTADSR